jgi:hypothetical protein
MSRPEDQAREHIDAALDLAGWAVQDRGVINLDAARGVAIREFPLRSGYGFAVEAKKAGSTLTGVEVLARLTVLQCFRGKSRGAREAPLVSALR